jgi:hypothetical protein
MTRPPHTGPFILTQEKKDTSSRIDIKRLVANF